MTNASGDHWTATVTCAKAGGLTVESLADGDTVADSRLLGGIVLIDPSGVVYDQDRYDAAIAAGRTPDQARTAAAIAGATVLLQRKEGGEWVDAATDERISPRANPQVTRADGRYQWDVVEGTYRVVVSRPGYVPQTSRAVDIPPAVTDLHVAMVRAPVGTRPGETPPDDGIGLPPSLVAPPATDTPPTARLTSTTPPTKTTASPATCSALRTSKRAACERDRKLRAALAKCSKLRGSKKPTCVKKAKALSACERLQGRRKAVCVKRANAIGRRRR